MVAILSRFQSARVENSAKVLVQYKDAILPV